MHHPYSNDLLNHNQFDFTPRKSAIDAVLTIKEYLEDGMREGHIVIGVSIDVIGAFDAVWWPSFLKILKELNCPKKLYNLQTVTLVKGQQPSAQIVYKSRKCEKRSSTRMVLLTWFLEHLI